MTADNSSEECDAGAHVRHSHSPTTNENPRKKRRLQSKKDEVFELSMMFAREKHSQDIRQDRIFHETQLRYLSEYHHLQKELMKLQTTVLELEKKYWAKKLKE